MSSKICHKCGHKNSVDATYCSKCGDDIRNVQVIKKARGKIGKKFFVGIPILIGIIALIISLSLWLDNPMLKFKRYVEANNKNGSIEIYQDKLSKNSKYNNDLNKFFKGQLGNVESDYMNNKITYDEAKDKLDLLNNFNEAKSDANSLATKINTINDSRISFQSAKDFIEKDDYIDAIKELNNVSSDDEDNCNNAKDLLEENKDKYKNQILAEVEKLTSSNEFQKAIVQLKDATDILGADSDIENKLTECNTKLKQKEDVDKAQAKETAKNNQSVTVENVSIQVQSSEYKALYPDMIQAVIKNNSNKTIKNFSIGFTAWDSNGYPIKIKGNIDFSDGAYVYLGKSEDANILSGATYGQNKGWELDENHNISTIYGCVKSVTFYDGSTWDNPYYDYWVDDYSDKPLTK